MKQIARIAILVVVLLTLSSTTYSRPEDVLGWEGTRWGMSGEDIVKLFGGRVEKQPEFQLYGSGVLGYIVAGIIIKGELYAAYFQMDGADKLSEVHVRLQQMESPVPREDVFQSLEALLTEQYGAPDNRTDERSPKTSIESLNLSRTWRFPTTTVELSCSWDRIDSRSFSGVRIDYFPSRGKRSDERRMTSRSPNGHCCSSCVGPSTAFLISDSSQTVGACQAKETR